jgi:hypothetical protein
MVLLTAWAKWLELAEREAVAALAALADSRQSGPVGLRLDLVPARIAAGGRGRLALRIDAPGDSGLEALTVEAVRVETYPLLGQASHAWTAPARLEPGQSWAQELSLPIPSGAQAVRAAVRVGFRRAGTASRVDLAVGPATVESAVDRLVRRLGLASFEVAKDLALPTALALLGFWYAEHQRKQEQLQAERERERDEIQARHERERERRQREHEVCERERSETWQLMLPTSHRYNGKFYLPLVRESRKLARSLGGSHAELTAYHLVSLFRYMRVVKEEIGGCFLKNHAGERLVAESWRLINGWFESVVEVETRDRAVGATALHASFADFRDRLAGVRDPGFPDRRRGAEALRRCVEIARSVSAREREELVAVLQLFAETLQFEANRVYALWYGQSFVDRPDLDGSVAVLRVSEREERRRLADSANEYLEGLAAGR